MFNFEPNPITRRKLVMSIQPYNEDKITISADDDLINVIVKEHETIKGMLKRTRDHIVSDFEMAYERRKKYIPERLEDNNPLKKFFDDSFPHLGMDDIHDITIELVLNPSGVMDAYSSIGLILPTNFEEIYKSKEYDIKDGILRHTILHEVGIEYIYEDERALDKDLKKRNPVYEYSELYTLHRFFEEAYGNCGGDEADLSLAVFYEYASLLQRKYIDMAYNQRRAVDGMVITVSMRDGVYHITRDTHCKSELASEKLMKFGADVRASELIDKYNEFLGGILTEDVLDNLNKESAICNNITLIINRYVEDTESFKYAFFARVTLYDEEGVEWVGAFGGIYPITPNTKIQWIFNDLLFDKNHTIESLPNIFKTRSFRYWDA